MMAKKQNASSTLAQTSDVSQLIVRETPDNKHALSPPRKNTQWNNIWNARWVYLLILPGTVYFLLFYYLPLLGNVAAFQNYSPYLGFFRSAWVGFDNFTNMLTDPEFFIAVRNTLVISILQIVFAFPLGLALSLALNAIINEKFKRFMQSAVYLPHFMGWVIIVSIWREIFGGDGLVNHAITGMGGKTIDLLTNPALFQPMMVLQVIWKESGWSTVMFLAALSSIDMSLYEAAGMASSGWRPVPMAQQPFPQRQEQTPNVSKNCCAFSTIWQPPSSVPKELSFTTAWMVGTMPCNTTKVDY
jgi:putative aldouronate transport system permease protein